MSEVAVSYEFPKTEGLVLEEWQRPVDDFPLYCNLPLPINIEPIVVKIEGNYVEIDRSVKRLAAAERVALQALLKHRPEPVRARERTDPGLASARPDNVRQPPAALRGLQSTLRGFTTDKVLEESRDGNNQMQLSLSERVVYEGNVLSDPYIQDKEWHRRAACLYADGDQFIAETAASLGEDDMRREYCKPCPVRADCLIDAVLMHEANAIHGGLLGKEVKKLGEFYHDRDAS